jgi:Diol dehydratase reactivase ATPase-like domain/DD-reactivating factor swiveling domain
MLIAGVDVGNATTEVILAVQSLAGLQPLTVAQAHTAGAKGSPASLRGARRLLEHTERKAGARIELVAICDLHPVETLTVPTSRVPEAGPVRRLDGARSQTPAGIGLACGSHITLSRLTIEQRWEEPVVVSVPYGVDHLDAAHRLNTAAANGWEIAGVLAAEDDAVLIHNRLAVDVPVIDEVDLDGLPERATVAIEVAAEGQASAILSDPAALAHRLGIPSAELAAVAPTARDLLGRRAVAVTRGAPATSSATAKSVGHLEIQNRGTQREVPLDADLARALNGLPPGAARALVRPSATAGQTRVPIRDAFAADLLAIDHAGWLRRGVARLQDAPLAVLTASAPPTVGEISAELGRPVLPAGAEIVASVTGARTTPGAPPDSVVLDIGGGTIDLAAAESSISAAGAGNLITDTVAAALGIPYGLAERVKRGPSVHILTPHLAHHEDGSRRFLRPTAPSFAVGRLATGDGSTLIPFALDLAPEEWRALRHAIKEQIVAANVERCLQEVKQPPGTLLVAGGGALDGEAVAMIGERLRGRGWVVARADVAGQYGPRFAVAWGAALSVAAEHRKHAA